MPASGSDAAVTFGLQLYALRWTQGRLDEVEELIDARQRSTDIPRLACVLIHMAAELGHEAESREALAAIPAADLERLLAGSRA
jgi:hypothetical protein